MGELTKVLHFDDDDQTIKFCEEQDLELAENASGELYLNWGSRPVDSVGMYYPKRRYTFQGWSALTIFGIAAGIFT